MGPASEKAIQVQCRFTGGPTMARDCMLAGMSPMADVLDTYCYGYLTFGRDVHLFNLKNGYQTVVVQQQII